MYLLFAMYHTINRIKINTILYTGRVEQDQICSQNLPVYFPQDGQGQINKTGHAWDNQTFSLLPIPTTTVSWLNKHNCQN